MGLYPNQQQNTSWKYGSIQTINVITYSINNILIALDILWDVNGFEEYISPIYWFTLCNGLTIFFIRLVLKNDKLFNTIELATEEANFSEHFNCSTIFFFSWIFIFHAMYTRHAVEISILKNAFFRNDEKFKISRKS